MQESYYYTGLYDPQNVQRRGFHVVKYTHTPKQENINRKYELDHHKMSPPRLAPPWKIEHPLICALF
jgi:hypothetical protein